jgi:hypothetical protein
MADTVANHSAAIDELEDSLVLLTEGKNGTNLL